MMILLRAIVAACIIYSIWKLTVYLLQRFRTVTECDGCQGKGWYQGVRERERCNICAGTGKKQ